MAGRGPTLPPAEQSRLVIYASVLFGWARQYQHVNPESSDVGGQLGVVDGLLLLFT